MSTDVELCFASAHELAAAIAAKRVSPVEVLQAVLDRLRAVNPKINAFAALDEDAALAAARRAEEAVLKGDPLGPLHGVPVSIKDLIPVAGLPTRCGSRVTPPEPAAEDGSAAARIRSAGAIIIGKTTTPEFGCKSLTDSPLTGVTRNPWNLDHTSGGSSGGAGASLAAGIGPLAIGSDGGGSIRIPASCCGIFGLNPTFGRVPHYPAPNAWAQLGKTGPMARTVRDAALLFNTIAGHDHRDPISSPAPLEDYTAGLSDDLRGLRLAWSQDLGYVRLHPEVRRLTSAAAKVFAELGADVVEASPGFEPPTPYFMSLFTVGYAGRLAHHLPERRDEMDPYLVSLVERGLRTSAVDYFRALEASTQLHLIMVSFFKKFDLLLTPVLAHPPLRADHSMLDGITVDGVHFAEMREGYNAFTFPFNLSANPGASVPCGFTSDGLPVGLQIVGPYFSEARILQAAAAYETARPWARQRPAL